MPSDDSPLNRFAMMNMIFLPHLLALPSPLCLATAVKLESIHQSMSSLINETIN
jgi:hypothetical protein